MYLHFVFKVACHGDIGPVFVLHMQCVMEIYMSCLVSFQCILDIYMSWLSYLQCVWERCPACFICSVSCRYVKFVLFPVYHMMEIFMPQVCLWAVSCCLIHGVSWRYVQIVLFLVYDGDICHKFVSISCLSYSQCIMDMCSLSYFQCTLEINMPQVCLWAVSCFCLFYSVSWRYVQFVLFPVWGR